MLYRKMYLYAVLFVIFGTLFNLFTNFILLKTFFSLEKDAPLFSLIIPMTFGWIPSILLGIFGNWLYIKHIHKKIDKGYHLCTLKNIDKLTNWLIFSICILSIPLFSLLEQTLMHYPELFILCLFFVLIIFIANIFLILKNVIGDKRKAAKALLAQKKVDTSLSDTPISNA